MSVLRFRAHDNIQISEHFNSDEFLCPCGKCAESFIDTVLIDKLEQARKKYAKPMKVTSGFRCARHNSEVGGVKNSAHANGLAADVQPLNVTKEELDNLYNVLYEIFDNIGDGRNLHFVHVDIREKKPNDQKRTWTY